ncbi:LysR family transcriptional regulator [Enterocloster bolteae]|uniref:LysR family transcriptional regulator n=1 Tax=Enterocloster bolteae TaxID=208479 RepID=UPI0028DD15C0|nr:LysR family transcriptional regulator [Enterocloster bolteae]
MEIRVLSYFLMVAREENITRAAQLLHITQPTLSRQLMQLEEELGVELFNRSNHRIILTEDGMLLKRRAQEMISLADKTKREFIREENLLTGELSIGCGELCSVSRFSELIASFREKYPQVRYELYSGNADNIKDRIERGLLDIGLLSAPVDISKYEFVRMPEKETWGILVREDSPLAVKEAVRPEDLAGVPLLTAQREMVQNELVNWFGEYSEQMEIIMTYNLIYNAAMMVKQGIGAALCLKLENHFENLCFVPLSPVLELGSVLAWKKNQVFSPAAAAFIRHVRK